MNNSYISEGYKQISDLYSRIPKSTCKEECFKCCTNMIQFSPSEAIAMGGYEFNGLCSHLKDGRCSIYENRPFVCRIFGTSELLKCDDCNPERFLSEAETNDIVHQYVRLKNAEEMKS